METIQLQCGSCGQMMGISTAHLGSQVQCPHCQAVVQTPAPPGQLEAPAMGAAPQFQALETGERDSIFGQPEARDDLFDAPPPQIEMPLYAPPPPVPPPPVSQPVSRYEPTITMEPAAPQQEYVPAAHADFEQSAHQEMAPILPRQLPRRSILVPILLIFLVPYSICTTAFVAYLLYLNKQQVHPLKMLPDPTKAGAPRLQVRHDMALPDDLKVALGQTLRIGDIEVTPRQVKRIATGDLVLVFRARNVSADQIFTPLADEWLRYSGRSMTERKPYTFLERQKVDKQKIYGGNLEWARGAGGQNQLFDGELNPGEEAVVQLTTEDKYRPVVNNMIDAPERLLWRVQVRRGLVDFEGERVSATAVVGVDFSPRDIVKEADEG